MCRVEKKADPGVPNSFPFKDQVLAEIAEEKRKVCHSLSQLGTLFMESFSLKKIRSPAERPPNLKSLTVPRTRPIRPVYRLLVVLF